MRWELSSCRPVQVYARNLSRGQLHLHATEKRASVPEVPNAHPASTPSSSHAPSVQRHSFSEHPFAFPNPACKRRSSGSSSVAPDALRCFRELEQFVQHSVLVIPTDQTQGSLALVATRSGALALYGPKAWNSRLRCVPNRIRGD